MAPASSSAKGVNEKVPICTHGPASIFDGPEGLSAPLRRMILGGAPALPPIATSKAREPVGVTPNPVNVRGVAPTAVDVEDEVGDRGVFPADASPPVAGRFPSGDADPQVPARDPALGGPALVVAELPEPAPGVEGAPADVVVAGVAGVVCRKRERGGLASAVAFAEPDVADSAVPDAGCWLALAAGPPALADALEEGDPFTGFPPAAGDAPTFSAPPFAVGPPPAIAPPRMIDYRGGCFRVMHPPGRYRRRRAR